MPICIINGAVGGTRIDQHQRNDADPTDAATIYGRLLWRVQQARLTHGIRGVLWHQGENDQGADGPTGGYGWETYRQYFIDLAAAWKQDYPNIQHYYVFQIWPKSCSMGDQRLGQHAARSPAHAAHAVLEPERDVDARRQAARRLPLPGGGLCRVRAADRSAACETRSLSASCRRADHAAEPAASVLSAATAQRTRAGVRSPVVWSDALVSQFHLDGEARQVASGSATGNRITLKLKSSSQGDEGHLSRQRLVEPRQPALRHEWHRRADVLRGID